MASMPDDTILRLQEAVAGRFAIEREVGRGGMGMVFLARDLALDRLVAIKVLPAALASSPDARLRFLREARTSAGLAHPNIVPIYSVEERGHLVWFVMAYVPGETLADRIRRTGPLPPGDALRLVQEVAWALAYAHQHGVIHRDVKPANILIERGSGRAMVTDFGIAVAAGAPARAEGRAGTPPYMSPEQHLGDPIDGRSDLFSLGVSAYLALTGQLPYADTGPRLLAAGSTAGVTPVTAFRRDIPAALAAAVHQCLSPDPGERPGSGEALAEALAVSSRQLAQVPRPVVDFLELTRSFTVETAGYVAVLVVLALEALAASGSSYAGSFLWMILTYAVPVVAGLGMVRFGQMVRRARALLKEGYAFHDVEEAIQSEIDTRVVATEPPEKRTRWLRRLGMGILGAGVAGLWVAALAWWAGLPSSGGFWATLLDALLWAGLTLGPVAVVRAGLRQLMEPGRAAGSWLWKWALDWKVFRVASLGLKMATPAVPELAAPAGADRATALFEALPREIRRGLADLPEILRRLEREAAQLKSRHAELDRALVDVGSGGDDPRIVSQRDTLVVQLRASRDAAKQRHAAAETAIETLRLGLLRIRYGLGGSDDLTQQIEAARALGSRIDAMMDLEMTPTPTPS